MCTGIMLRAQNNDTVRARTLEWSAFDLESNLLIFPRNFVFKGAQDTQFQTHGWQGKYGHIALNFRNHIDFCFDGLNEKGFSAGLFYHPDTAQYDTTEQYNESHAVGTSQIISFVLSQCASVTEAKNLLLSTHVTPIIEDILQQATPAHYIFCDQDGKCSVMEFIKGEMIFTDNPLGVITNAPSFDWHMTNLRNYLKLSTQPAEPIEIAGLTIKPLSAGTELLGLPGDYTSPARFVRAVAFSQSARKTKNGNDAAQECFRILDNFNVGVGGGEGADLSVDHTAKSTTVWTTAADSNNLRYYYHTQYNRRTRMIDLKKINFDSNDVTIVKLDNSYEDDIKEVKI